MHRSPRPVRGKGDAAGRLPGAPLPEKADIESSERPVRIRPRGGDDDEAAFAAHSPNQLREPGLIVGNADSVVTGEDVAVGPAVGEAAPGAPPRIAADARNLRLQQRNDDDRRQRRSGLARSQRNGDAGVAQKPARPARFEAVVEGGDVTDARRLLVANREVRDHVLDLLLRHARVAASASPPARKYRRTAAAPGGRRPAAPCRGPQRRSRR